MLPTLALSIVQSTNNQNSYEQQNIVTVWHLGSSLPADTKRYWGVMSNLEPRSWSLQVDAEVVVKEQAELMRAAVAMTGREGEIGNFGSLNRPTNWEGVFSK